MPRTPCSLSEVVYKLLITETGRRVNPATHSCRVVHHVLSKLIRMLNDPSTKCPQVLHYFHRCKSYYFEYFPLQGHGDSSSQVMLLCQQFVLLLTLIICSFFLVYLQRASDAMFLWVFFFFVI